VRALGHWQCEVGPCARGASSRARNRSSWSSGSAAGLTGLDRLDGSANIRAFRITEWDALSLAANGGAASTRPATTTSIYRVRSSSSCSRSRSGQRAAGCSERTRDHAARREPAPCRRWTIVTVEPGKHWRHAGHPYLSGRIIGTRIDATALGLVPLASVLPASGLPKSKAGEGVAGDRDRRSSWRCLRSRRAWPRQASTTRTW